MEVFSDTFVPTGLGDVWAGRRHCPRCVWTTLRPVMSLDQPHWLCPSCGHCYGIEHGRIRRVDPVTCLGCSASSKRDCIAVLQAGFPNFAAGAASDDEL
jgi:hypothetical protein